MLHSLPSIILASQSPRRRQLLEWAEVNFTVEVIPTSEAYPANLPIEEVPVYIAREKARALHTDPTPCFAPLQLVTSYPISP